MSIEEKIRVVRQNTEMNQREFAEKIGIGQAGLSAIEKGIRNVTDRNITLICDKFSVNEHWLRTGEGEPFNDPTISLDEHARQNNLDDLEIDIIKVVMSISKEERVKIINQMKSIFSKDKMHDEIAATKQKSLTQNDVGYVQSIIEENNSISNKLTK